MLSEWKSEEDWEYPDQSMARVLRDTEKTPRDLNRLVPQTSVKDQQLTLMWKTHEENDIENYPTSSIPRRSARFRISRIRIVRISGNSLKIATLHITSNWVYFMCNGGQNDQSVFFIWSVGWLFRFYGISTVAGYLRSNLFFMKILLFQTIQFSRNTQFNCQKHFYFKLFSLVKQFYFIWFSLVWVQILFIHS